MVGVNVEKFWAKVVLRVQGLGFLYCKILYSWVVEESLKFEWGEDKNKVNISLHKISFETAKYVWNDPFKLIRFDDSHSENEDRYQVLGKVGKVLFVIFTESEKDSNIIRIISARVATPNERRAYYGEDTQHAKNWRPA